MKQNYQIKFIHNFQIMFLMYISFMFIVKQSIYVESFDEAQMEVNLLKYVVSSP